MRKLFAALLLSLIVALPLPAGEVVSSAGAFRIDVDSATVTYFRHVGQNQSPTAGAIVGPGTIETVGSSTTVVESVTGALPFTDIGVGDILVVAPPASSQTTLRVETKASGASITVFPAVDLGTAGVTWRYYKLQSGTTVNDGWFDVAGGYATISLYWNRGDLDGLLARWECRYALVDSLPQLVFPGPTSDCGVLGDATTNPGFCTFTSTGVNNTVSLQVTGFSQCRVGLRFAAADAADVAGTTEEDVRVLVQLNKPTP